jgi:hypothetical protein
VLVGVQCEGGSKHVVSFVVSLSIVSSVLCVPSPCFLVVFFYSIFVCVL